MMHSLREPGASSPKAASLDHLVGLRLQGQLDRDAERPSSPAIDDELELGRLLDRQIGRLAPLEYLVGINREPAVNVREARPVEHQSTSFHELAPATDCRQPVFRGKLRDQL